jgi:hypothetical protein
VLVPGFSPLCVFFRSSCGATALIVVDESQFICVWGSSELVQPANLELLLEILRKHVSFAIYTAGESPPV